MSDVETAFNLTEYSEYSEPPSETNVTMEDGKLLNLFDQSFLPLFNMKFINFF